MSREDLSNLLGGGTLTNKSLIYAGDVPYIAL